MKVLFLPVYLPSPHLETEMELMSAYLAEGHEVYAIHCRGELPTCFANWKHRPALCLECRGRFQEAMAILDRRVKVIPMPFQQPPEDIPLFQDIDALKTSDINSCAA